MKRWQIAKTPAIVWERKSKRAPLSEHTSSAVRRRLDEALGALEEEYLIIASKEEDNFLQFAGQGDQGMRAEAISNTLIKKKDTRAAAGRGSRSPACRPGLCRVR